VKKILDATTGDYMMELELDRAKRIIETQAANDKLIMQQIENLTKQLATLP
jgi:choline kinase